VITRDCGRRQGNPAGYCIGGLLLVLTLAWIAAGDDEEAKHGFGAPTFMVSLQDYSEVGTPRRSGHRRLRVRAQFETPERSSRRWSGRWGWSGADREMANMFNLLRPRDLIAERDQQLLCSGYSAVFDLLYWNSDGTCMPRPLLLCEKYLPLLCEKYGASRV
jgi:polyhydroxyalkanoate synthase subunit PhaC